MRPALVLPLLLLAATAAAEDGSSKKQVDFLNRSTEQTLTLVREQLRTNKGSLAVANIKSVTASLTEVARLTKEIRAKEPAYVPNPPVDFDHPPATARHAEYAEAKRLAQDAAKKLNQDYSAASDALLKAKNRQIATIAISALKMTVENAPGRPGGKAIDLVTEGCKQLNGYLMDKYISGPITNNLSEAQLLKDNFVTIQDGEKLLKSLLAARDRALEIAKAMDQEADALKPAVDAEKEWQAFKWLKQAGADRVIIEIVEVQSRNMQVLLGGFAVDAGSKGKVLEITGAATLEAKVKDSRRQFCLDKKKASASMKTIVLEPGPGGAPEDSLVYSSSVNNGRSSWTITRETFEWAPSFNTSLEDDPRPVSGAYWKLEKGRVLWKINAKRGEQANFRVTGKVEWHLDQRLPGGNKTQDETNDGSATVVVRVR